MPRPAIDGANEGDTPIRPGARRHAAREHPQGARAYDDQMRDREPRSGLRHGSRPRP
ncbi:hypothetical protein LC55x_5572 [Lysobacter capsici]|nr:hypothetical protein LC55x_5572 [Lysobacter capsici]